MKKIIAAVILFVTLATSACASIYPDTFAVKKVNRKKDYIVLESWNGYTYKYHGSDDWQRGDVASCIMSDNNTPFDIRDDIVLMAYYVRLPAYADCLYYERENPDKKIYTTVGNEFKEQ